MKLQISKEQNEILMSILNKYKDLTFFAYGSRAKSSSSNLSDLDLLILQGISKEELSNIIEDFENSNLRFRLRIYLSPLHVFGIQNELQFISHRPVGTAALLN